MLKKSGLRGMPASAPTEVEGYSLGLPSESLISRWAVAFGEGFSQPATLLASQTLRLDFFNTIDPKRTFDGPGNFLTGHALGLHRLRLPP